MAETRGKPAEALRVSFERFELDEANASLTRDGKALALPPTPFAVLCALARRSGILLSKHALLDEVWGHEYVSDSVLKTVISDLRTVLDDDPRKPRFIETVSRRGYRFIAPTRRNDQKGPAGPAAGSAALPFFIGRAQALPQLRDAWEAACNGRRTIMWVAGEPGIGKTTLIEHFVAGLGDVMCVRGQCVEQYGGGEPYLPVLEALAEMCRRDNTVAPLLRAVAPTWLLQLPWLSSAEERDVLRRELAGVGADRALREMGELFDRYTEHRPLLLVTEDLHWSDRATIQLIDYIARRRGGGHLMWLASFRVAEVVAMDHPFNAVRRELRLHGLSHEVVLDRFSEREVAEYLAERSPSVARDEAFVRALHARTDGLPLFVASVVSEISERAGPAAVEKMAVPENLAAIIEHYIARLGDDERIVLSAAAVCSVEFRIDTVARALERDAAWVAQICDALARERLWLRPRDDEEGAYVFRHALFRQVLYERTAAMRRVQLHRAMGTALERERSGGVPVAAAELAMHFERAREPMTAVRYYAEAAEAALARFSPEECLRITEGALALLEQAPQAPERTALEITIATLRGLSATRVLGSGSEAKSGFHRAYSRLDQAPQHPIRGRLLHGFGFLLCLRGEYAEALAVAERAEALGAATNNPVLLSTACTLHGEVDQLQGRWRASRTWLERGLALAERLEVGPGEFLVDPQVMLLSMLSVPLVNLGLIDQARACVERAYRRARDRGWPMAQLVAIWHSALVEVRLGDAERVAALAGEMHTLVDQHALAHGRTAWRWFRAWADARMGAARDTYPRIREAYEENARLGMLTGGSETLGYAAEALLLAGDLDGAQKQIEEAIEFAGKLGERVYLPQLFLIEAAIARAGGEPDTAAASVRRAIAEAQAEEAPWAELLALVELCESAGARASDRRALAALVAKLPEAQGTAAIAKARAILERKNPG
jgi:DNA-binding winged helix-turn-helix (wHTH) protein/tetratricopeptide (TPR) repeat protein